MDDITFLYEEYQNELHLISCWEYQEIQELINFNNETATLTPNPSYT